MSILSLRPIYPREAEINPWDRKPLSLIDYVNDNALPIEAFVDGIETDTGHVFFCRFFPDWAKSPVDLIVMNMKVNWKMRGDGSVVKWTESEPDRGPFFTFSYDVDTEDPVLYDHQVDDLLHAFVSETLSRSINSLERQGLSIEDARRH